MIEKGILYTSQMMRMVYEGKKLQTRRVMPVQPSEDGMELGNESGTGRACIQEFHELWDSINKKRGYGWKENLYNWVYDFNPTWLVWGDTSL